ncbi:cell surface glycoprotein CD200 receptor 1-B-like [Agelaius phoeniceus]|uniref:cell surface glycoprotein CD200 receptor 1-B-like n=1 Tax=Agelaius phoeniceus TaxID=39638 RepID=UPI004054D510
MKNHTGILGSSHQAGQCKKAFSSTKARPTLKVVRKSICTIVLLTIAAVTGTTGNNSSVLVMTVGNSSALTCFLKGNITMLTWTITPKAGGLCTLVYRVDTNETHRTTCSDNINWIFRAGLPPALGIWQVGLAQEGNYSCEAATTEGNFHTRYHLTVLGKECAKGSFLKIRLMRVSPSLILLFSLGSVWVHFGQRTRTAHPSCSKLTPCMSPCWCFAAPPRLSLSCDEQGSPVCEAAAGKPPAQLSWVPEGSSTAEEKCHNNGTVTVLSKFTACSTNVTNVTTCMVSHPAGNWSQSISCCPSEKIGFFLPCVISLIGLMSLLFLLAAFELYIFFNSCVNTMTSGNYFQLAPSSH